MSRFLTQHARSFSRSTAVSLCAAAVEFVTLALLAHVAHAPDWMSYGGVQFLGTTITFLLNKYWAFDAARVGRIHTQGAKSALVFGGSFALNTALPSVGSYLLHREPVLSFAVSQVLVYVSWNYPMNRYWVFRKALPQRDL